jgi:hypothetical protein
MNGPFSTVLGPILVLWTGALILYVVDRSLESQDKGIAEVVVLALSHYFLFRARAAIDVPLEFGTTSAFAIWPGLSPFVVLSPLTWLLAFLLLSIALLSALASLGSSTSGRSGRLATWGAALFFLSAGDRATLAMAWLLVDVALLMTLNNSGRVNALGRSLIFGALGVAAFIAGSWLVGRGGGDSALSAPRLLLLAGVLRLLPPPLPTWQTVFAGPGDEDDRPFSRVMVYAVPTLLTAHLWARTSDWGLALDQVGWPARLLSIWVALILLWAAVKAWGGDDPDSLVRCAYTYGGGLVLLGASLGVPPAWERMIGVMAVTAVSALHMAWIYCQYLDIFDVNSWWRAAPTLIVVLCLIGFPLTPGFPARISIYHGIWRAQRWLVLILVIAAEALFASAMLRVLLELEYAPTPELAPATAGSGVKGRSERWRTFVHTLQQFDWPRELRYGAGAALALGTLILGVAPHMISAAGLGAWFALPTLPMWAALLLPVVGAIVIYRSRDSVLDTVHAWWPVARRILSIEPVYRTLESVLAYLGTAIWGSTQVVEGEGHMAWVAMVCLVIYLFVITR